MYTIYKNTRIKGSPRIIVVPDYEIMWLTVLWQYKCSFRSSWYVYSCYVIKSKLNVFLYPNHLLKSALIQINVILYDTFDGQNFNRFKQILFYRNTFCFWIRLSAIYYVLQIINLNGIGGIVWKKKTNKKA